MSRFTVTVIDTTGIQPYIFSSNRLRENIGASHLVSSATKDWVEDILEELGIPKSRLEEPIESSGLNAELVYAGGGNALIIFRSRDVAVNFTKRLSNRVLKKASGINLVVGHKDFDWDTKLLYQVVKELMTNEMERRKYERIPSAPLLGLGVTANCNSTQLPAVDTSDKHIDYEDEEEADSYLISTETKQKLEAASRANKKLQEIFAGVVDKNIYQFPYRIDHLGRSKGEFSYAAVIHADGNGMGKRFQKHGEDAVDNRDYINRMRDFSQSVDEAGRNALRAIAEIVIKSIEEGKIVGKLGQFPLKAKYSLPFRPLVYGGDDITLVCSGRLGLELAALFLREFEKQSVADGQGLTACAGVCVVKTHYPFARAYQISEDLCKNAKRFVKEHKDFEPDGFSAIDWHLAASGLVGSISDIRKREYQVTADKKTWDLAMRPVRLRSHNSEWRIWEGFTKVVKEFKEEKDWKERHNKVMDLREVLRKVPVGAVEEFCHNNHLPQLPLFPDYCDQIEKLAKEGWLDRVCGYFDAIEAMDFYISLGD